MSTVVFTRSGDTITYTINGVSFNLTGQTPILFSNGKEIVMDAIGKQLHFQSIDSITVNGVLLTEQEPHEIVDIIRSQIFGINYQQTYKQYVALLTQSGTNAPVATVLANTLGGTVVWSYDASGQYHCTLSGAFVTNKTWITPITIDGSGAGLNLVDANTVSVYSPAGDDVLVNTSIEIRVYY
jgi:hypothetical protein